MAKPEAPKLNKANLVGRWVHAHEEDSDDQIVYRKQGEKLGLSRGRRFLSLEQDGTLGSTQPGPDDRPADEPGTWHLDKASALLSLQAAKGVAENFTVVQASKNKLVLKRNR